MKRKVKNTIAGIALAGMIGLTGGTIYLARSDIKNLSSAQVTRQGQGMPGGMNGQQQPGNNNSSNSNTPPSLPNQSSNDQSNSQSNGQNSQTNDQKDTSSGTQNNSQSNDQNSSSSNTQNNSQSNSTNTQGSQTNNQNTPPSMPDQSKQKSGKIKSVKVKLPTIYYGVFTAESIAIAVLIAYLIMSKAGKMTIGEALATTDRKIIAVLVVVLLTSGLTFGDVKIANSFIKTTNTTQVSQDSNESSTTNATGKTTVTSIKTLNSSYKTSKSDESAILVKNGGKATVSGTITKSGDASNTQTSEFAGVNSAILVHKGSSATINKATIKTTGKGSNAVFATGTNAKITIKNSTITTTGSSGARGLDATYGGSITGDKLKITTQGASSATLATDRGEGTIKVSDSTLETNGAGSPIIYSTGNISLSDSTGSANKAQMVVVEGKNSATVTNSKLTAIGIGNRNSVDNAGVMIYQSMSGDAGTGTGNFTAKNSTLTISSRSSVYKSAPMFFVTNTSAKISLTNTTLNYGSNTLLSVKGTSEWGISGSNGGNVTFNASKQTLSGNIVLDKISTLKLTLKKGSSYTGAINTDNSAKSVTLTLDKSSKIKLTGNTYVTSLTDADSTYSNIDFNGYKLYVNGKAIN